MILLEILRNCFLKHDIYLLIWSAKIQIYLELKVKNKE
ncbi:hypothetical protein AC140_34590 [Bacteroides fragilis]|nr:hypothetical protein AC140_34590 [Bacteroides fragilis]